MKYYEGQLGQYTFDTAISFALKDKRRRRIAIWHQGKLTYKGKLITGMDSKHMTKYGVMFNRLLRLRRRTK